MPRTPEQPRPSPTPIPAPSPPEETNTTIRRIEEAIEGRDPFLLIFHLNRFTEAPPEDIDSQTWSRLYLDLTNTLGSALGVPSSAVGITSLPLLEAYRQAFAGAVQLQMGLSAGNTPESMLDRGSQWIQDLTGFLTTLGRHAGEPLALRLREFMLQQRDSFQNLMGTFRAAGVAFDPPTLPPVPGTIELPSEGAAGDVFGPGAGGGGFASFSEVVEELRPPTAEEFLLVFDNAFLTMVGAEKESLTPTQEATLRERRNELLGQYVARLGQIAEEGGQPFVRSTRTGEVVSRTETTGDESGSTSRTTRFGVETDADVQFNFLVPAVTPVAFLTELFPTTAALKNFAVSPFAEKSRVGREGFAPGTRFSDA